MRTRVVEASSISASLPEAARSALEKLILLDRIIPLASKTGSSSATPLPFRRRDGS